MHGGVLQRGKVWWEIRESFRASVAILNLNGEKALFFRNRNFRVSVVMASLNPRLNDSVGQASQGGTLEP